MKTDIGSNIEPAPLMKNDEFHRKMLEVLGRIPSLIVEFGINTDVAIDRSLAEIGQLINASRVYVMQDEKDGRYLRNTHEWVSANIRPFIFSWPLYDYEYDLPSLRGIMDDKNVFFGNTRDLPNDINRVLSRQGMKSVILAPLFRDGKRIGLVGCEFSDVEVEFCDEYRTILIYLTGLVSIALERKQYQTIRNKLNTIRLAIADVGPILAIQEVDEAPVSRNTHPVSLVDVERRIIIETLELYNGNKLKTAKHLGLTWPSLDRRCKKMGIEVRKR